MTVLKIHIEARKRLRLIHTTDRHMYKPCNYLPSHLNHINPRDQGSLPLTQLTTLSIILFLPPIPNTTMLLRTLPASAAQVSRQHYL